jgi:hypothetical protein
MAKQRPSVQKRQREYAKRQRELKKAAKAAEKRERRLNRARQDAEPPDEDVVTPGADDENGEPADS